MLDTHIKYNQHIYLPCLLQVVSTSRTFLYVLWTPRPETEIRSKFNYCLYLKVIFWRSYLVIDCFIKIDCET